MSIRILNRRSSATPPINLGAEAADCFLRVGESGYIVYTSATSIPLRVITVEGVYSLDVAGDVTGANTNTSDLTLTPNYGGTVPGSNSIKRTVMYRSGATTVANVEMTQLVFTLGAGLVLSSSSIISTMTKAKTFTSRFYGESASATFVHNVESMYWDESTVPWVSLGLLTMPFAQSGKIVIQRLI